MGGRLWTDEDIQYLTKHYKTQGSSKIAKYLGRTKLAVRDKAKKLGLKTEVKEVEGLWTAEEETFMEKYYAQNTAAVIAKKLGRSEASILGKAKKMKLKTTERQGRRIWDQDEERYLAAHYNKQSIKKLAQALDRSKESVQRKAQKMGLTTPAKKERRSWTKQEEAYMERMYEKQSAAETARKLKRTVVSVRKKARALGLNAYASEYCNASAIAECFQVDVEVIRRWIEKLHLPAQKILLNTKRDERQVRYLIDAHAFWKWAEEHRDKINWSRYIPLSLPPEPQWVEKERENCNKPRHHQPVTPAERMEIRMMIRTGKTYEEIAKKLGRTRDGISHIGRQIRLDMSS